MSRTDLQATPDRAAQQSPAEAPCHARSARKRWYHPLIQRQVHSIKTVITTIMISMTITTIITKNITIIITSTIFMFSDLPP